MQKNLRRGLQTRDATFRKMTNQNQTDTNEMTTTETRNTKPIFILPKNANIKPTFNKFVLKIPIKYQEITNKFET